jgi:hypothetical protein
MSLVHEIHSSELRGYRRCRQLWDWRYRDNWEPIKKPAPLEDGTVWHKALEVLYNPETWTALELAELHGRAYAALIAEANTQQKAYCERAGKYKLDDIEAVEHEERINLLRNMLVNLCRSLDREKFKPIAVEQEFGCVIRDDSGEPLRCTCERCWIAYQASGQSYKYERVFPGLPVTFNCRIDALFEDLEGYIWAVDHKSASVLHKPDSVVPELEDQLPSYLWCLKQNGYLVTGIILNQFRKAYPKPPKRLERLQLGRMYSVNKLQLTDYPTARQVFYRFDSRAYKQGLYNEYLVWLKDLGPQFSRQFANTKTREQLTMLEHNIRLQAMELINDGPSIYPDPNKMNCDNCAFQSPCLAKQAGQDYADELRSSFIQSEPYYIQRRKQG